MCVDQGTKTLDLLYVDVHFVADPLFGYSVDSMFARTLLSTVAAVFNSVRNLSFSCKSAVIASFTS